MNFSDSPAEAPAAEPPRYLSLKLLLPYFLVLSGVGFPLVAMAGWYLPGSWTDYSEPYASPGTVLRVYLLCGLVFLAPLFWVVKSRTLDLFSLALAQEALIFSGYFYMDQTSYHLYGVGDAIIDTAGLVVLLNLVGFISFFVTLGLCYNYVALRKYRLAPIETSPEIDTRLAQLFRILSLACGFSIALPMALTRTIPLLSSDETGARMDMVVDSDLGRSVYHMGTALLPFVVATMVLTMIRQPKKIFGWNGILTLLVVMLQLLTSNRLPLSITLMVTLCLITMHYKVPRALLLTVMVGYLFSFTFLSGFTSLLRTSPTTLSQPDWFNASMQEAYLGDNIIDLRDGSWVLSQWDYKPLLGKTYLGGAFSFLPSGVFPMKKQWHLGLTAVRIVGFPDDDHFGLRITFFGEAFLNFGWAGVIILGMVMGMLVGVLLRQVHLAGASEAHSLTRNIMILMTMQAIMPLSNTSDAFITWVILVMLLLLHVFVVMPGKRRSETAATSPEMLPLTGRL